MITRGTQEGQERMNDDAPETVQRNPQSWAAWKREAERLQAELTRLQGENERLTRLNTTNPKRVCMDCGEVFEWSQVDDIGRCGRCYSRFVNGQDRLNPGAGVHPDKRYVPDSQANAEYLVRCANAFPALVEALRVLYDLLPDVDDDYLLDGNKGEFALKAIRVPGIGAACLAAREALKLAEGP